MVVTVPFASQRMENETSRVRAFASAGGAGTYSPLGTTSDSDSSDFHA